MTSQSNDVIACEIGKSHMAFSHGQNLSYTGGNVRKENLTWLSHVGKTYLKSVEM
jgi:hypothetical protein